MKRVISVDLWGAALLAALGATACGGEIESGAGGSAGTGGKAGATNPFPCNNPQAILVGGQDTGYDRCEGGSARRREARACPSFLPRPGTTCDVQPSETCSTDTDCTSAPHGYCTVSDFPGPCYCGYGCTSDADCKTGQICSCGNPVGQCVTSSCVKSADCEQGYECAGYVPSPGCPGQAFACQTSTGQCAADTDCGANEMCSHDGTQHVCAPINCVIGRPFIVEGLERLAAVVDGAEWIGDGICPRIDGLDDLLRARLAEHWSKIGLMEHAAVAAFARFALQLLGVGAPPALVEATQAAMADETEHTRLCFALASAYAGKSLSPGPLDTRGALPPLGLDEIVELVIREGCIGETVAALEAAEALEHVQDPAVRTVLARVTRDEHEHALLAWRFLQWVARRADAAGRRRLHHAFDVALTEVLGSGAPASTADDDTDAGRLFALGVVSPRLRAELRRDVCERIVRPCAEALLAGPKSPLDSNCAPELFDDDTVLAGR